MCSIMNARLRLKSDHAQPWIFSELQREDIAGGRKIVRRQPRIRQWKLHHR